MKRRDFLTGSISAGLHLSSQLGGRRYLYAQRTDKQRVLQRPMILPLPSYTTGVKEPVVSLNGEWRFKTDPDPEFWRSSATDLQWDKVLVPGQADRQGFPIKRGKPYAYKQRIPISPELKDSRIFLRFESVSGTSRLWINGNPLEDHRGGFTVFNREITRFVRPGEEAELAMSVTDADWNNWPSGFDAGGILRGVKLVAVPQNCITRLHAETTFDSTYTNATLRVDLAADLGTKGIGGVISIHLTAPNGADVPLSSASATINAISNETVLEIPIASPQKWDAEHPNLYRLTAELVIDGRAVTRVARLIGFRQIEIREKRLFVNGIEVKLRGGGRFDSDPHLGHTLNRDQCEEEVRLFKAANLNYIRPACFPAMEEYLEACDRLGMYVEGENNVTFTHGPEQVSSLAPVFLGQASEMLEANRSHACILFWSIGNESNYGANIQREFDYVRAADPTRPIIFSWSHGVPADKPLPYNIYSYHYPDISADMGKPGVAVFNGDGKLWLNVPPMPVLHDEYAHLACYDRTELRRDPNVRNFWGEGIRRFWEKMYTTDGCLGGAVWALVDEPDTGSKTYSWGAIDLYRRQRPEYWLLRKAYSPVRLGPSKLMGSSDYPHFQVTLTNWFNHSNLNELLIRWKIGEEHGSLMGPDVPPRGKGSIAIPGKGFGKSKVLELSFHHDGLQVEETHITLEDPEKPVLDQPVTFRLKEVAGSTMLEHGAQRLTFDTSRGSLGAAIAGVPLILSGPKFHLAGAELPPWVGSPISLSSTKSSSITMHGSYGQTVSVHFDLTFQAEGWMRLQYTIDRFGISTPTERVKPWNNTDKGGFEEIGISLLLPETIDHLSWKRKALYTVYPPDHIGRPEGVAVRHSKVPPRKFGETPTVSWSMDEQDFDLYGADDPGGRGTNDFRSAKEYMLNARAIHSRANLAVELASDGTHAVRLEPEDEGTRLIILDQWNYSHLGNGNYMRPAVQIPAGHTASICFRLVHL